MSNYDDSGSSAPVQTDHPMKWHKFLVYFALWASALYEAYQGYLLFTGASYGKNADAVYLRFSGLKNIDTIFGIIMFLEAAYIVYTTLQLMKFKQGAPGKLMLMYLLNVGIVVVYLLIVSNSTGISFSELAGTNLYSSIAGAIVGALICKNYYDKRSDLFVN